MNARIDLCAIKSRWLALALIVASACTRQHPAPAPSTSSSETAIPSDLVITLERTWCLGTCPIYEVAIDASGHIGWFGHDYVDITGQEHVQIPVEQVRALVGRFDAMGFDKLHDSYDVLATDIPGAFITLQRGGQTKRVHLRGAWEVAHDEAVVYVSDDEDPDDKLITFPSGDELRSQYASTYAALDDLARVIDEAASTARWIFVPPKKLGR